MNRGYRFKTKSPLATLTKEAVLKAREDYKEGKATQSELAKRLQISQAAVSMLIKEITYKWVGA